MRKLLRKDKIIFNMHLPNKIKQIIKDKKIHKYYKIRKEKIKMKVKKNNLALIIDEAKKLNYIEILSNKKTKILVEFLKRAYTQCH